MTSDSLPPSQELNYPPVQVDHSLTELDLETLMMRSLAPPRAEELGSSLDESTYELLGDSQFETSDDEGHTASIASTDDRTPDDASAFSGDDDDDDNFGLNDTNIQESTYLPQDESEHTLNMQSVVSGDSSILTEIPGHMEDSDSLRQIKLDERTVEHSDAVQGSKSVKSYWAHESPEVFGRYDCKELRLVVRAGLSQRPMPTPDAYRVLYIGKPDKWLEDTIVAKLSEALTASPSISKSVVVRGQVEPYNPTIHVWRCTEFQPVIENGDATHVLAILDDGQRLRFGPKLNSTTLGRPDLVVLCHPTISGTDKQDFARAEKVFKSEAIPCINIGQVRAHGDGSSTYDPTTLAMCVEGRDAAQEEFKLKEVLPLDHFAFSQLDALQLNRHLASISPHLAQRHDKKGDDSYYGSWWKNASSIISKRFNGSLLKSLTLILLSLVIVPAIMQGVAYAPGLLRDIMGTPRRIDMNSVSQGILTGCSIPTSKLATPPLAPDASLVTSARSELTLTPSQVEVPKRKFSKKKSASGQYEIKVMSDRQFVLDFKVNRKKPQLRISVARDSQVVPVQYNRMIDGEYVVDLVREYSSGLFNVSISTYSKPLLQQSFGVVLGHNRSRSDMLINTAKLHVQDYKLFFTNVSSFAIQYVKAGLNVVDDMAHSLASETEQLRNAQSEISSKILSKGKVLRGAPKAVWKGIRQATAPIRTSTPMIKARQNALRMRCNMETAAGFSGNSEKGESWACAKWREMDVGHER